MAVCLGHNQMAEDTLMKKLCAALFLSLWLASAALAQQISGPIPTNALACVFNTAPPTLPTAVFGYVQCDANGKLITSGGGSVAISSPLGGGTQAAAVRTTLATDSPGIIILGPAAITSSDPVIPSSQYPGNNTASAAPITGNATGSTGAVVGTLAAAESKTTFICGFNISATGVVATVGPVTVAGLIGSSQVYQVPVNATAGQVLLTQNFNPCIPASAANTAITITTTADGTATAVDVNSWGYQ